MRPKKDDMFKREDGNDIVYWLLLDSKPMNKEIGEYLCFAIIWDKDGKRFTGANVMGCIFDTDRSLLKYLKTPNKKEQALIRRLYDKETCLISKLRNK